MSTFFTSLNDYVRKQARREIRRELGKTLRAASRYRREIASLKREIGSLQKHQSRAAKVSSAAAGNVAAVGVEAPEVAGEAGERSRRFRADGLKTHRAKLGLSAKDYGRLVGVSALSVYAWEAGKRHPRAAQLERLAQVRAMGKREAYQRLGVAEAAPE